MKPTQMVVLLVIVVVMVFAVTFGSMYVTQTPPDSPGKGGGKKSTPGRQLVFVYTRYPEQGGGQPVVSEFGQKNYHDFWFENPHDEEVRVGLNTKNCSCSEVGLFVAPPQWRKRMADAEALFKEAYPLEEGAADASAAFTRQYRKNLADGVLSSDRNMQHLLKGAEEGVLVPAGSIGFIRLGWERRREMQPIESSLLRADLWMQDKTAGGPPVVLQVGVLLVDPVRLDVGEGAINAGTFRAGDSASKTFRCWSSTRKHFDLKLDTTGKPFVVCAPPAPLTEADRRELEQFGLPAGSGVRVPILSGYRVTVEVRERVSGTDGEEKTIRQIDQGPFEHTVTLTPRVEDEELTPLTVAVRGLVKGDVTVVGSEEGIGLGSFSKKDGITPPPVTLRAERTDMKLKLDKYPDFMTVKLTELPADGSGRPHWELSLKIAPGVAPSGRFPRADNSIYSDTAIYLKDARGRRVRIPVVGTAILR